MKRELLIAIPAGIVLTLGLYGFLLLILLVTPGPR
jgi:hypothetical protein